MSRSNSRRVAAYPRGRPRVIPFPPPRPTAKVKPKLRFHAYFAVGDIPVHVVGERWRQEDVAACPAPTFADPSNPAIALTIRADEEQVAGVAIRVVSCEEYHALAEAFRRGSPARRAGAGSL